MKLPKTFYICGPISGLQNHNYSAFDFHAAHLREQGFEVVSPAELHPEAINLSQPECDLKRNEYLQADLNALAQCDGVAVLPGWRFSAGAMLELHWALERGMPIYQAWDLMPLTHLVVWACLGHYSQHRATGAVEAALKEKHVTTT